uniref:Uncharacterized protein n=1 Tax=Oryza punctata TaxID=4537 RepID=A0A0E0KPE6_ORYPU
MVSTTSGVVKGIDGKDLKAQLRIKGFCEPLYRAGSLKNRHLNQTKPNRARRCEPVLRHSCARVIPLPFLYTRLATPVIPSLSHSRPYAPTPPPTPSPSLPSPLRPFASASALPSRAPPTGDAQIRSEVARSVGGGGGGRGGGVGGGDVRWRRWLRETTTCGGNGGQGTTVTCGGGWPRNVGSYCEL